MVEEIDDSNLFELKNEYMLGNYQSAINHSENIQPSSQR